MAGKQGQDDATKTWLYSLLYWSIGLAVGWHQGYVASLLRWRPRSMTDTTGTSIGVLAMALIVTVECQRRINTRFSSFDRPKLPFGQRHAAYLLFAVGNGTCETFLYLYMYNLGRHIVTRLHMQLLSLHWNGDRRADRGDAAWLSTTTSVMAGFVCFFVYSALIHALFWLPWVLPRHVKETAPPFARHGLPLLTMISVSWLAVYELLGRDGYENDAIAFVCLLHGIVDAWLCETIRLSLPTWG